MSAVSGSARYHHRRPFDQATYDAVRVYLATRPASHSSGSLPAEGAVLDLAPSQVLRLTLAEGPQVVHLFAWNTDDPDERIWTNETSSKEDAFLTRDHRIWGTMAHFRPLLTVVEDSLADRRDQGETIGPHHFVLGGRETPIAWKLAGGDPRVPSVWDRFRALLDEQSVNQRIYRDHISLFQHVRVDVPTQSFDVVPSQARAGERLVLFAEIALKLALVPCPSRAGGTGATGLDGSVRRVEWEVVATPVPAPGWPYPGLPYPDLSPYVDATGSRT